MQEIEQWQELKRCPGYQLSSNGVLIGRLGRPYKMSINKKGYPLIRIPMYKYSKMLHRAVAEQFVKGDHRLQVNHKDGNKLNASAKNLEFVTCKENINHAIDNGLRDRVINLRSRDLFNDVSVRVIRDCFVAGFSNVDIAKYFKCNHSTISKIRTGIHYPNLGL